jgi:asparagine synthase (glutamine-hydrolysing)
VKPWLPREILDRPKQGFQIPMRAWLRGAFGDFARAAWNDSGAAQLGYLRPAAVERLFEEHRRGAADHSRILYAVTVFALWWMDASAQARRAPANAA